MTEASDNKKTLAEVLRRVVEMEKEMKTLAESIDDFNTKEGLRMTGEDETNIQHLIHSTENFRLFARDILQIMGKYYVGAARWANHLFEEDCH